MHRQDAIKLGETEDRLLLDAWRESALYTERERAALAWAEALARIAETHAPDAAYEEAGTPSPKMNSSRYRSAWPPSTPGTGWRSAFAYSIRPTACAPLPEATMTAVRASLWPSGSARPPG
jgi:hypothetical protein